MKLDFKSRVIEALRNISIDPETGCWLYNGRVDPVIGYGRIHIKGRGYHLHRLSAYIYLGLDLDDWKAFSCHKCNNRLCCNPEHLYIGTNKQNQLDARCNFCKKGHDLTIPFSTYPHKRSNGKYFNECRKCRNIRVANNKKKMRGG